MKNFEKIPIWTYEIEIKTKKGDIEKYIWNTGLKASEICQCIEYTDAEVLALKRLDSCVEYFYRVPFNSKFAQKL